MIAWRLKAGPRDAGQGRKPAEPGARSASLDRYPAVRQRSHQALMANLDRRDARGVNNPTFSGRYKKSQAGVGEHTSCLVSELFDLFRRSTGPHIAAFILPSLCCS
jgi:hypothetical protein